MSYDFDGCDDKSPPRFHDVKPVDSHDLETIVTLLELAAISLTKKPGDLFTKEELVREARAYGGSDIILHDVDIDIVLPFMSFLKKLLDNNYRLV